MSNKIFDAILTQGITKKKTEKQQKIVETAIQLFAEKGYANTSTAEIAKASGVSEGTIFKHYGTKDRLLLSVILPFVSELFPQMAQEVVKKTFSENTTTFEQFLRSLIKNRVEFVLENKEIFQVVIKEFVYKDELKKELLPFAMAHIPPIFKYIVEDFKERGELIDLPAERIMKNLLTFLGGFFVSRFLLIDNYTVSDEEIEDAIQFVLHGLRNPRDDVHK
ncbi:MAG TPA: TetR/AcrR family transcriptional regulator [Neobacillus sp.]